MPHARNFTYALLGVLLAVSAAAAQGGLAKEGLFVSVPSPFTTGDIARVKGMVQKARNDTARPIRTVVFDFTPGGKDAAAPTVGELGTLAEYIGELHELETVAFVSAKATGHVVLPVLACKELVMGRKAALGEITKPGETLKAATLAQYDATLGTARDPLKAVVRKMADPAVSLGKGTKNGAEWFLDLRERDAFTKTGGVVQSTSPLPIPPAQPGAVGLFSATEAKAVGLAKVTTADTRQDVAEMYGLSPASLRGDAANDRPLAAFRYVLRGPMDGGVREATKRVLADVTRQKATHLFVQIECGDGDLSAARDIADLFSKAQTEDGPLVVGFLGESATPAGSLIALGCNDLVVSRRADQKDAQGEVQEAELCDFEGLLQKDPNAADFLRKNLKELLAGRGLPEVLADGMLDRDLELVRVHAANQRGLKKLMTGPEFEAAGGQWVQEGTIKPKGVFLKLNATRAAELGLARAVDGRTLADVYPEYGVEAAKVKEATPGMLDRFATFLRLPAVTVLLVVIGFAGLILELKVPGTTVPGIIAALCFILIFWAHTGVNGNAAILGGLIFLLGVILILLEVFVIPGFGAPGILGILFMLGGIGLATLDRIPQTGDEWVDFGGKVGIYLLAMIGATILSFTIARFLPSIPGANRLMLAPPTAEDVTTELPGQAAAAGMLGAVGSAATALRPAGMAQFGDQYVDVVTEGGFIASGARIQVIEVEGTRVVVREV